MLMGRTDRPACTNNDTQSVRNMSGESPGSQWEGGVQWRLQSRGLRGAIVSACFHVLIIVSAELKEVIEQVLV